MYRRMQLQRHSPFLSTCTNTDIIKKRIPQKEIVDLFANKSSQSKKFAIHTVKNCFEELSLTWISTIK